MSTAPAESSHPGPVISHENLLFDFPEADLILRSCDSYEFRVLKLYIVHSSPILGEKVLLSPNPHSESGASAAPVESSFEETAANAPCVVQLPIDGAIIFSLLTYIFPVPPLLPSTVERTMELLSVAQMYKMDVVLGHIRNHIADQEQPFIRKETAFLIYSLAQKHGLRKEALEAARCTLSFSSLTITDLANENMLDTMPGAFFYELWKYHKSVRSYLKADLEGFLESNALAILGNFSCDVPTKSGFPYWLDGYISEIGSARVPAFLDSTDFYMGLAEHLKPRKSKGCTCSGIPRRNMRAFWGALTATVHGSIAKAGPNFALPTEETVSESQARPNCEATSPPKYSEMPNADVILQSSDLIRFRVNKSVLITSSPFFGDMFSLPQPPNDTAPDELPVVQLSEDSEVLNSLISILYPVPPEMPDSSDNILALLSAATKYDMDLVQSSIREEISRRGMLSSTSAEIFRVYAVACSKKLIPEMATAARLTLGYPLTFESLGDVLRLFEGCALRDLADFRVRSINKFCSNWESFSDYHNGPSKIWVGCPTAEGGNDVRRLPTWLQDCLRLRLKILIQFPPLAGVPKPDKFTETIPTSEELCDKYLKALQSHVKEKDCNFCMKVHILEGDTFCAKMKDISKEAWNIPTPMLGERLEYEPADFYCVPIISRRICPLLPVHVAQPAD